MHLGRDSCARWTAMAALALLVCTVGVAPAFAAELCPNAAAAVLMDAATGRVLFEKAAHEPRAPASLTKIMTLVLVLEAVHQGRISLDDVVVASYEAARLGGSQIWLEPGEEMSVRELILAVAIASANDACVALAEHLAGSEERFVRMMNDKARQLGLRNTNFINSYGLDEEGQHISAYDVAVLARYAVSVPQLLDYTRIYEEHIREGKMWLVNTNRLVRFYPGCDGLKTGMTGRARYCLAATAQRNGTRMIAVVLGCPDSRTRFAEAVSLLNWGFANWVTVPLVDKGERLGEVPVSRGAEERVAVLAGDDLAVTVEVGREDSVSWRAELPDQVEAPVRRGQEIGRLVALSDGEVLAEAPLVAAEEVPRVGMVQLLWRLLSRIWAMGAR